MNSRAPSEFRPALGVFVLGLLLTGAVWRVANVQEQEASRQHFARLAERLTGQLAGQLRNYEKNLAGAQGLYAASKSVERHEWNKYINALELAPAVPGVTGFGFAARVSPAELPAFLSLTRKDESPWYQAQPADGTNDLILVKYLEPQAIHQAVLGRNLNSSATLRPGFDLAQRTGKPTLTALPTTEASATPALLYILPVYRNGQPSQSEAQRQTALEGWVYAALQLEQLMPGLSTAGENLVRLEIWDVTTPARAILLCSSPNPSGSDPKATPFEFALALTPAERQWELRYTSRPEFHATTDRRLSYAVIGGGCLASSFLGLFVWSLTNARTRAQNLAGEMTRDLKTAAAELLAAHQESQAREARFRSLSGSAPIGIFETDAAGQCLYTNPYWQNITGLTLEQSLGAGWQRALHPDDAAEMLAGRTAASQRGEGFNHEFRFCRPSGEVRWVQARSVVIRSQSGAITGYVGTTEDITEQRKAEELLRLQEAALRSAANVVIITNREGNIVWTNPAFTRVTGYTAAEALGQNPRVLKSKAGDSSYPPNYYQDLWKTISSGQVWHGEFHNVRKDGSDLIEEATITPVPNGKGELTHFVAVKQDITARKSAEAELARAQKELLAVSRQAGMAEVATGVLHNVGNVLNSVNVSSACVADRLRKSKLANLAKVAELLRTHEADLPGFFAHDPRARQLPGYLAQLADHLAGEHANALAELAELHKHIEHIKDIIVMQQDFAKFSGVTETLPVTDLLEDALRMNASSLVRHDIRIRKEFAPAPAITVDKHKVLQILVNLLHNAKQACDEAGRDDKQITLRVMSEAGHVRISVADNGVGIPPENLDRVFNHGFTTRKTGHGFGLHSGANAAREMGGHLHVHSAGPGHGATFTLELPVIAPHSTA